MIKLNLKKLILNLDNCKIKFLELEKNKMWINKYIVIPAYYRDVDTKQASIGVGEINKLYSALIIASKSLLKKLQNMDYH